MAVASLGIGSVGGDSLGQMEEIQRNTSYPLIHPERATLVMKKKKRSPDGRCSRSHTCARRAPGSRHDGCCPRCPSQCCPCARSGGVCEDACIKAGVRCEHCIAVEISPQERQVGGGVTRGSFHEAHEKGTRVKGRAIELFDTIPEQVLAVSGPDFDALLEALKIRVSGGRGGGGGRGSRG